MKKVYIIGTVHNMFPKHKRELTSILKRINPDQVLVEIDKKDLKSSKIKKYPKEMIYAYKWAIKRKKKADGFDYDINIIISNKKVLIEIEKKITMLIDKIGWKSLNKKKYSLTIEKIVNNMLNKRKALNRRRLMLKNIKSREISNGKVLILTGVGHLSFFERHIKGAIFPLRR